MEQKDNMELNFKDIQDFFPLERRDFLKLFGGGIVIFISMGQGLTRGGQRRRPSLPSDFNAFLHIREDGSVNCLTGKIEMGQGVITSLAQMLADELEVPLESVNMIMGDTDLCPWDMGTFGSMTTRFFGPPLRAAAAEARAVLLELAAEHLKRPKDRLKAKNGEVYDTKDTNHKVTYAQLTRGKKIERHLENKPSLKKPEEFRIMSRPVLHRDSEEKVTGKARYAADMLFPDLLHAKILRPPAHGAKLLSADVTEAKKAEGTLIVQDEDFIAVLHLSPDIAEKALLKIKAKFERPQPSTDDKTIFNHLLKVAPPGEQTQHGGILAEGQKISDTIIEKKYLNSYVAHAPIEPHTATAKMDGDRIFVWPSTQTPFPLKDQIAGSLKIAPEKVRIIPPYVGGGFGGKTSNQQAVEAARLAQITGKPVQVAWSRAEEFFYDSFRPAAIVKIKSGIDKEGRLTLWDFGTYFAGQRGSDHFYDIPHHRTTVFGSGWRSGPGTHPFATGAWRAPGNNTNTFARESHIEIMATAAGMDPYEFRLKNLKNERMKRVLKAVAQRFGYKPAKAPSSRGIGFSLGIDAGTFVAHVAEVDVDKKSGRVQVKRVVCAQDMGISINPQGALIQMEGCINMGLGYALSEEIHFKDGELFDLNFDTYEFTQFSWIPKIECLIVPNTTLTPQGGGEPAIINMGAVIANAIYDATGARLLQLPMTPTRVKDALKTGNSD